MTKCIVVTSTLALVLAAEGYGGDYSARSQQQQSQRSYQQDSSMPGTRRGEQQTLRGTIEGFRHMNVTTAEGRRDVHSFIIVELDDGTSQTVDLGPKRDLDDLNLQRGERIQLEGRQGTAGGRRVLVADRLRVDGETRTVQRRDTGQQTGRMTARGQQRQGELIYLAGTLDKFRHVGVRDRRGQQQTHTLAQVQLNDGRVVVADLGQKSRLQRLNLQQGERIRLQGHQGTINQRPVLLVDRFTRTDRTREARQRQDRRRETTDTRGRDQFTVRGTVQGYQVVSIGQGEQQQVLLNLQLEDGRSIIIDAGDYQPGQLNLKDLNLQDQVLIQARRVTRGERQMLVADDIRFEEPMGGTSRSEDSQFRSQDQSDRQQSRGQQSNRQQQSGRQQDSQR